MSKIAKIKQDIKNWRVIARSGVTPKLPGEGFEKGWRLAINRVCNTIGKIINTEEPKTTTIDYDPVMKIGAVYYGDTQICDLNMAGWQADMIDELVKEHITKGIEG